MPSAAQVSAVGVAYTYGRRTYKRLFEAKPISPSDVAGKRQTFPRIEGPTDDDLARADFCEVNWLRNQAIVATKPHAKDVKPLIRQAGEAGDRATVKRVRAQLAKERAAVRNDLRTRGGIVVGLNDPVPKKRTANRDAFILCLGFLEMQARADEKERRRAQQRVVSAAGAVLSQTDATETEGAGV